MPAAAAPAATAHTPLLRRRGSPARAGGRDAPPARGRPRRTLAARLGQSFNPAGIALFARILMGGAAGSLPLPHLDVPDLRALDWPALAAAGFRGAVFDKDNTLTEPYARTLTPAGAAAVAGAVAAFGPGRVALLSNSAGLAQFDPHGEEADSLEADLGVPVVRHASKKPAGGAAAVEAALGAPSSALVMVGDRYLTDVVYGNRHGMLTVRPAPVTAAGEPAAVRLARRVERVLVARARRAGRGAPPHALVDKAGGAAAFLL
jgi:phosphatidylglycerophosphatase GEP4